MIFQLPIRQLFGSFDPSDNPRHLADWDDGIDLRVDWDGDQADAGTFDVLCQGRWQALVEVSASPKNEQIASRSLPVTSVRVQRGPRNKRIRFAAKLVPIDWARTLTMPQEHHLQVHRGTDYHYRQGHSPDDIAWEESQQTGGVHCLTLQNLIIGQDYEMWVRLWHPHDPDRWQDQDPVIRSGETNPPDVPT